MIHEYFIKIGVTMFGLGFILMIIGVLLDWWR